MRPRFSYDTWKPDFSYYKDIDVNSELMQADDLRVLLRDDEDDCVNTHSDVWLLANERRMDSIRNNPAALKRFTADVNSIRRNQSGPQFSDEDLMAFCKSRQIQTLSELKSWTQYLINVDEQRKEEINNERKQVDRVDGSTDKVDIAVDNKGAGSDSPVSAE